MEKIKGIGRREGDSRIFSEFTEGDASGSSFPSRLRANPRTGASLWSQNAIGKGGSLGEREEDETRTAGGGVVYGWTAVRGEGW